jgi:ADP-heptose:LPS heptosyltransferase
MRLLLYSDNLIGDSLMTTPAIRAWKQAHPGDELHMALGTDKGSKWLFERNPYVTSITEVENENIKGVCAGLDAWVKEHGSAYDRCLHLDCSRAFQWGVANRKTITEGFGPQLGVSVTDLAYDLALTEADLNAGADLERELGGGKPVVVCARHSASCTSNDPTIRAANKCVPNRIWGAVNAWLWQEGFVPVAVGGPADQADERWSEWTGPKLYGASLPEVAGLLFHAAGTIAVDTGIRHMAAAVGGNLFTLSGAIPLELIRCAPVRSGQKIVEAFRELPYWSSRAIIAGAGPVLK